MKKQNNLKQTLAQPASIVMTQQILPTANLFQAHPPTYLLAIARGAALDLMLKLLNLVSQLSQIRIKHSAP